LFGAGPGSAGSTLGARFPFIDYVTPHNDVLKFAVEGGLVGGLLFVLFNFSLLKTSIKKIHSDFILLIIFIIWLSFGSVTSMVEAQPFSTLFCIYFGYTARVNQKKTLVRH
jgi:O-antigen ligase